MTSNQKTMTITCAHTGSQARTPLATIAAEAAVETLRMQAEFLRAQNAQMQTLVDAYAEMSHATAAMLRARALACAPRRVRPAPPPVATELHQFAAVLTNKIKATIALLNEGQRARLAALVPGFVRASLANEPDVVAMVVRWLAVSPADIAHDLGTNLDAFARRFAL